MNQANRGFLGGLWHGAFLGLGMSLTHPTTVIAAFVSDLTGSTIWVGGLSTVLIVAAALPQVFVARWIEPQRGLSEPSAWIEGFELPHSGAALFLKTRDRF